MSYAERPQAAEALQEFLDELHITSLDDSDIEAGLQDLNGSDADFGSGGHHFLDEDPFEEAGFDDNEDSASLLSGVSAEVRAALAISHHEPEEGVGLAALEAQLRLSGASGLGPSSAASVFFRSANQRSSQEHLLGSSLAAMAQEQESQGRQLEGLRRSTEARECLLSLAPGRGGGEGSSSASPFAPATAAFAAAPAGASFRLQMQDLAISEAAYQSLRSRREEELTVREWVQLRFHELRSAQRAESQRLQLEVEALRDQLLTAQTRAERFERQFTRRDATVTDLTQELEKQRAEGQGRLEQLTSDLRSAEQQVRDLTDKGRRFDVVDQERAHLREEVKTLREAMASQSAAQHTLSKDHADASERLYQLEADLRLARKDGEAHERRAKLLEETLARRDDEVIELRHKVEALREKKRELARKVALEQVSTTQEVRDHVNSEIRRFQEQAKADLEAVRTNLNALHEKEVAMLRERVAAAEGRSSELSRRLEDEEQRHQVLQLSSGRVRAELQNDITELTGALKLRAFEVERAALTHEEVSMLRQKLDLENEQLRQQVEVLRKECYTLEVQFREGRAAERAELASLREQLRGYVDLERELDSAIRACAEGPGSQALTLQPAGMSKAWIGSSVTETDVGEALLIGTTLASAPASAQRRIQQSLVLAQELQRRTREALAAKAGLSDAESEIARLEQELEAARREARGAASSEPQAYLLSSLREREAEALRLRRELRTCSAELDRSRQQAERAQSARLSAEEDLRKLLAQRQHLDGLRTLLVSEALQTTVVRDSHCAPPDVARAEHRGRAPTQQPPKAAGGPAWLQRLQTKLKSGEEASRRAT